MPINPEADNAVIAAPRTDENEEHIRLKFYTLLATCKDQLTSEYFMPGGQPYYPNVVARNSVAVIFAFSKWPEDIGMFFEAAHYARAAALGRAAGILGRHRDQVAAAPCDLVVQLVAELRWWRRGDATTKALSGGNRLMPVLASPDRAAQREQAPPD